MNNSNIQKALYEGDYYVWLKLTNRKNNDQSHMQFLKDRNSY
jgi:hypothetical protein